MEQPDHRCHRHGRRVAGTQPASLTTGSLLNADLPVSWQQQRSLLGIV